MILSNLNEVSIEEIIQRMKDEPFFALLLHTSDKWAIFISDEFLSRFTSTDGVKVCGQVIYELWGEARIAVCHKRAGYAFYDHADLNLRDWGFRVEIFNVNIDKAASELKVAMDFVRDGRISALSANEVLEMSEDKS